MGLNMRLFKVSYKMGCYIREEAIYWRKANAIHGWFVRNCQDGVDNCAMYDVDKKDLELLKSECEKVLKDHTLAEDILPTTSGFFFGSMEYGDMYFSDLEFTVRELDKLLKEDYKYFEYQSSW